MPRLNPIYDRMSYEDKRFLTGEEVDPVFHSKESNYYPKVLSIYNINNVPVSFTAVYYSDGVGQVAVGTDPRFRERGFAAKTLALAVRWFESHSNVCADMLEWLVRDDNYKSIALAKKFGFEFDEHSEYGTWSYYVRWREEPLKYSCKKFQNNACITTGDMVL